MNLINDINNCTRTFVPTGAYLNESNSMQSSSMSMQVNECLFSKRTSPHLKRLWTIVVDEKTLYYTTLDSVFDNTDTNKYFKRLVEYQTLSGMIEPRDFSAYKYRKLYGKLNSLSNYVLMQIPEKQKNAFIMVLRALSSNANLSIRNLDIQLTGDNELAIYRKESDGTHYILVGEDINDVSYLFISNAPGVYNSLHTADNVSINNIVDLFTEG